MGITMSRVEEDVVRLIETKTTAGFKAIIA